MYIYTNPHHLMRNRRDFDDEPCFPLSCRRRRRGARVFFGANKFWVGSCRCLFAEVGLELVPGVQELVEVDMHHRPVFAPNALVDMDRKFRQSVIFGIQSTLHIPPTDSLKFPTAPFKRIFRRVNLNACRESTTFHSHGSLLTCIGLFDGSFFHVYRSLWSLNRQFDTKYTLQNSRSAPHSHSASVGECVPAETCTVS